MGQLSIVKNGVEVKLPHGFRFCPTDEELVLHYLRRKVFDVPLPTDIIPQIEVCNSDPWDLPGDLEEERYFFSGRRSNRETVSGYWKATGVNKPIFTPLRRPQLVVGMKRNIVDVQPPQVVVIGMKKTFVFYKGNSSNGTKTDWVMYEYHLASLQFLFLTGNAPLPNHLTQENWIVCLIKKKKNGNGCENSELSEQEEENGKPAKKRRRGGGGVVVDLNEPPVSSPTSSGITEISCDSDDDDEQRINLARENQFSDL